MFEFNKGKSKGGSSKEGAAKSGKAKGKVLRVDDKSFSSPKEISDYYRKQGEKVRSAVRQFNIGKVHDELDVAKKSYMKIMSQRRKLEKMHQDIEVHLRALDSKVNEIKGEKKKKELDSENVKGFSEKIKGLRLEAKKIFDLKEELLYKESDLVKEMEELTKGVDRKIDFDSFVSSKEFADFVSSKDMILLRAKEVLSNEAKDLFSNDFFKGFNERVGKEIRKLNSDLDKVEEARRKTLEKMNLLEISEREADKRLAKADAKIKRLEERYRLLLGK
ncbi:MAG: hypothetical protein MI922_11855 [Bacteroidales bacterium]|nr:hypothetical protein [Bacteroidales bacterium]